MEKICKNCHWRVEGFCTNDLKLHEKDHRERFNEHDDHLVYSYLEDGGFEVGENFGCVHFHSDIKEAKPKAPITLNEDMPAGTIEEDIDEFLVLEDEATGLFYSTWNSWNGRMTGFNWVSNLWSANRFQMDQQHEDPLDSIQPGWHRLLPKTMRYVHKKTRVTREILV